MPLTGTKAADVSGSVATSYATKLMADYGATVVNFEGNGFRTRDLAPFHPGTQVSAMHGFLQQNKASVSRLATAQELNGFDVVFYDSQTTSISCETNTSAISWFGKNGPYAKYNGSDAIIHAMTGLMRGIGTIEGPPIIPSGYEAQIVGGLTAYIGTLGYLLGQSLGNQQPQFALDTSIWEANLCLTEVGMVAAYNTATVAPRMGINSFPPTYPLGIFPCRDGWLGVTVLTPSQWRGFCKLLDIEELLDEPRYHSSMARLADRDIIEPKVLEKLLQFSAEELFYRGQQARIPLARVPTMEELFNVDQYIARQTFGTVKQGAQQFRAPNVPFRLFSTPPHFGGPVAELGEHNLSWSAL